MGYLSWSWVLLGVKTSEAGLMSLRMAHGLPLQAGDLLEGLLGLASVLKEGCV